MEYVQEDEKWYRILMVIITEADHVIDPGVNMRIILKWIMMNVNMWSGLI
jgi:hypothetical protein